MSTDQAIRSQLRNSLQGGEAFDRVESILQEIPVERRFEVPTGAERSAWQILEHMRLSLEDLVQFSDNAAGTYQERDWPEGYWPKEPDPYDAEAWDASHKGFLTARNAMEQLIADPRCCLTEVFPWGDGQTLLREALLAIQHTSYHAGELVELARMLGPLGPGAL